MSVSQSLVLDCENGEQVKAVGRVRKRDGMSERKTMATLKSHSEAEKRRRQRINSHLSTLRALVPGPDKMNKATLLAAVICQVKELKKIATESSKDLLIPMDVDEVTVEPLSHDAEDGNFTFRATLCCDYRPDLLSDLRESLGALHLKMVKAEISTLGDRMKCEFVFASCKESRVSNAVEQELLASSVHQALISILYRILASPAYLPRNALPNKRQRLSFFNYPNSSSYE
uniref:Transcription factor bHLH61 n=1 Tax=Nothapodytes nimmoniana TaxID=159386 RepID=A0A9E8Z0H4_NOTNI|nr:transcription factor bHLH61 [Nothapodytes nimmoniana]